MRILLINVPHPAIGSRKAAKRGLDRRPLGRKLVSGILGAEA